MARDEFLLHAFAAETVAAARIDASMHRTQAQVRMRVSAASNGDAVLDMIQKIIRRNRRHCELNISLSIAGIIHMNPNLFERMESLFGAARQR